MFKTRREYVPVGSLAASVPPDGLTHRKPLRLVLLLFWPGGQLPTCASPGRLKQFDERHLKPGLRVVVELLDSGYVWLWFAYLGGLLPSATESGWSELVQ